MSIRAHGYFCFRGGGKLEPEYVDIETSSGALLRIVYEVTIGDLLVGSAVALLLAFLMLNALMKLNWR